MNMTRIYINSVNFLKRKGKKKLVVRAFYLKQFSPCLLFNFLWDDAQLPFSPKISRSKFLQNDDEKSSFRRANKIEHLSLLYNNHIECPKLEILLATKRIVYFFQKASKLFGLILHCFTSSLLMNGVENLRQRFNGQRQAKNNQRWSPVLL